MVKNLFQKTRQSRAYRSSLRWLLRHMLSLHGSPQAVALGTAIGVFVAFTPLMGVQMLLAIAIATILGASRVAAIPPVWISNPATAVPLYLFCYRVGRFVVEGPSTNRAAILIGGAVKKAGRMTYLALRGEFDDIWDLAGVILSDVRTIMLPLWIGCLTVGLILGMVTYALTLRLILAFRRFLEHRRAHRKWKMREKNKERACEGVTADEPPTPLP